MVKNWETTECDGVYVLGMKGWIRDSLQVSNESTVHVRGISIDLQELVNIEAQPWPLRATKDSTAATSLIRA